MLVIGPEFSHVLLGEVLSTVFLGKSPKFQLIRTEKQLFSRF